MSFGAFGEGEVARAMTMSCDDVSSSRPAHRFEVFTGAGQRRDWGTLKAAIVAESYSGQESVSAVARRHGLRPSQLFTWRRELRKELEAQGMSPATVLEGAPSFVPAVVEPMPARKVTPVEKRQRRSRAGTIELEIDGVAVKIASGADKRTITAVIEALKATR